ncbi:TerB family tellurite resistance protein [Aminobacter anthyllidis]|uniref:TerB family tellurite resistance protein n=1 Tax=Aminobacter anthyllidis TaxID=1035067 RepID=A0A9X1AFG3_9HYPH|nr:TerB family tellurite resistance protein [Aminobacter anthyllidis]MBT1158862.1 TerB family tellurite resistance protein [Aminobacter anthyllidis]
MFERMISFLKDLPAAGSKASREDDPRVAAAALMYHVMDADGDRQDVEWERVKQLLSQSYGISGAELDRLIKAGEQADNEAVDLYAFTSVLKRSLDDQARKDFIGMMWEIVYADGELHEMEDNTIWRIAELIGVESRDRVEAKRKAAQKAQRFVGPETDE